MQKEKKHAAGKTYYVPSDDKINTNALALALDAARSNPLWSVNAINSLISKWVDRIQERERFVYVPQCSHYLGQSDSSDLDSSGSDSKVSRSDLDSVISLQIRTTSESEWSHHQQPNGGRLAKLLPTLVPGSPSASGGSGPQCQKSTLVNCRGENPRSAGESGAGQTIHRGLSSRGEQTRFWL